jgi:hypothetical protein
MQKEDDDESSRTYVISFGCKNVFVWAGFE